MEGRERDCARARDFQTNVRATASYTIPWVDVLASETFSYRPGVQTNANYAIGLADLVFRRTPSLSRLPPQLRARRRFLRDPRAGRRPGSDQQPDERGLAVRRHIR